MLQQTYLWYRVRERAGRWITHAALIVISALCFAPFLLVVSASLSDNQAILDQGYRFLPVGFSLDAYRYLFLNPKQLLDSYRVSVVVTLVGTALGLLLTSMLSYAMSRRTFRLRNFCAFFIYFPMLFSGGLVPFYILMTQYLNLKDNIWALILPGLINGWNVLILRTYFAGISEEILDAARVDGANEFRIYWQIVMPLSLPALVTIGLGYVLAYWNNWFNALLFITKRNLFPLQYLLHQTMARLSFLSQLQRDVPVDITLPPMPFATIRMATVVLAMLPVTVFFLWLQKFFVRGLTLGALKG